MANRNFSMQQFSLEKQVVTLYAIIVGAGAAAFTYLSPARSKGFNSTAGAVVRAGVGIYSFLLSDPYVALLNADITWGSATGTSAAASAFQIMSSAAGVPPVVGLVGSPLAPSPITIRFYNLTTGAAVDPAVNDLGYLVLQLSNSGAF